MVGQHVPGLQKATLRGAVVLKREAEAWIRISGGEGGHRKGDAGEGAGGGEAKVDSWSQWMEGERRSACRSLGRTEMLELTLSTRTAPHEFVMRFGRIWNLKVAA